ncbi:MAG: hypothetical protein AWM53_00644 [Candidatus Dichloromethanomonas elyunquensis]|nr:MAG: hypothetical protein AWM53_00644 [Candidatus Dichloromethanomonas elyunquensis]
MKLVTRDVRLCLNMDTLNKLVDVYDASAKVAERCQDSGNTIQNAFLGFSKGVTKYAGEKKRPDLDNTQNSTNFDHRMKNTVAYFKFNGLAFDAVFKGIVLRRKSVEFLAQALFDLTLEGMFYHLGNLKQAKNAQADEQAIKNMQEQAEKKYFNEIVQDFRQKVEKEIANAEKWFQEARKDLETVTEGATKARKNAKCYLNKIENFYETGSPKGTTEEKLMEWYRIWYENECQAADLYTRQIQSHKNYKLAEMNLKGKNVAKKNLASLSEPGINIKDVWQQKFAPGGEGEQLWGKIRSDCQEELDQLAAAYQGQIDSMKARIEKLPAQFQADAQAHLDKVRDMAVKLKQLEAKEATGFEILKDTTGAGEQTADDAYRNKYDDALKKARQQADKLQELSNRQEEISHQNEGILYRAWRWCWDSIYWVGEKIGNLFSAIGEFLGDTILNVLKYFLLTASIVTAVIFWQVTLFVGVMFAVLFLLMKLFQHTAWLVAYIGRWRSPTYLEFKYLKAGQSIMIERGVPYSHFFGEAQEETIKMIAYDADIDNIPDTVIQDKAAAQQLKNDLKAKVDEQNKKNADATKEGFFQAVISMAEDALKPERLNRDYQAVCEETDTMKGVMGDLLVTMKSYEHEFARNNDGFLQFVDNKVGDLLKGDENATWASMCQWLNMLGTQINLLVLGICQVLSKWWPTAIAAVLPTLGTASVMIAGARSLICGFFVIPCVTAFAGDFMAMLGVAFKKMILEEEVPEPVIVLPAGIPQQYEA